MAGGCHRNPLHGAKSKLIEKIAEAINAKKIPILADVRDESAGDVRIVLEPRSKNVDPMVLMETLFKQTDLETRISLNMNVLIDGVTPKVCSLQEILRAFLDFRQEVLQRRSTHRLEKIATRLEVLDGYIVAFLNLDRVIEIIRYEDDPKASLLAEDWVVVGDDETMADAQTVRLTEAQAEAILNMRLRNLRKLEEMELRAERANLLEEQAGLNALWAMTGCNGSKSLTSFERSKSSSGQRWKVARGGRYWLTLRTLRTCRSRR